MTFSEEIFSLMNKFRQPEKSKPLKINAAVKRQIKVLEKTEV